MPSENKTPNYGLNQWSGNEYVKRQDFVDDNLSIDTNLKRIEGKIDNIEVPVISVNSKTGAVVLSAADVGAETPTGAQGKANTAEGNAKTHANTLIGALSSLTTTIKTSIVNAINSLKGEVDAHKADDVRHFTTIDRNKFDGIAPNANNYVHPTTAGNKHIPTGGATGQFLKYSATGTATWATPTNLDVGLHNVKNYDIATQEQAEAGIIDTAYMSPLKVKQAIEYNSNKFETGLYVGDDASIRTIAVSFTPSVVLLYGSSHGDVILTNVGYYRRNGNTYTYGGGTAIVTNGFNVGKVQLGAGEGNQNNSKYCWIAFK